MIPPRTLDCESGLAAEIALLIQQLNIYFVGLSLPTAVTSHGTAVAAALDGPPIDTLAPRSQEHRDHALPLQADVCIVLNDQGKSFHIRSLSLRPMITNLQRTR